MKVEAYDEIGNLKYGVNPTQYFLVNKDEVLSGNNGFLELKLLYIDHLKEKGKISGMEYKKRKEEIFRGN